MSWIRTKYSMDNLICDVVSYCAWRGYDMGKIRVNGEMVIEKAEEERKDRDLRILRRLFHLKYAVRACREWWSMSSVPRSKVPRRLLRASLGIFRPPTSPHGLPSQTEYSAVSSQHRPIWHPGFLSHRSDGLELTAGFVAWSGGFRPSSLNVSGGT